jgi:hypothetical protein
LIHRTETSSKRALDAEGSAKPRTGKTTGRVPEQSPRSHRIHEFDLSVNIGENIRASDTPVLRNGLVVNIGEPVHDSYEPTVPGAASIGINKGIHVGDKAAVTKIAPPN